MQNPDGNRTQFFTIYKNPIKGIFHATQVTATYQYFDSDGNVINFNGKNAWLSVNSLNSWTMFKGTADEEVTSESVRGGQGATAYELNGSSIKVHSDGWAYADIDNYAEGISQYPQKTDASGNGAGAGDETTADGSRGWDFENSPYFFYGSVIYLLSGDSFTLDFGVHYGNDNGAYAANNNGSNEENAGGAWAVTSTTIPKTLIPEINYHFNSSTLSIKSTDITMFLDKICVIYKFYN